MNFFWLIFLGCGLVSFYLYRRGTNFNTYIQEFITQTSSGTINSTDWQDSLNVASQLEASIALCKSSGYGYSTRLGTCVHTQETCERDSNVDYVLGCSSVVVNGNTVGRDQNGNSCDFNQLPYLEWHGSTCYQVDYGGYVRKNVCNTRGLAWDSGTLACDSIACYLPSNSADLPGCIVDERYCNLMGRLYKNGECVESVASDISLWLLGTRDVGDYFVSNYEKTRIACRGNLLDGRCGEAVVQLVLSPIEYGLGDLESYYQQSADMLEKCIVGNYSSGVEQVECAVALAVPYASAFIPIAGALIESISSNKNIMAVIRFGEHVYKALVNGIVVVENYLQDFGDKLESALESIGATYVWSEVQAIVDTSVDVGKAALDCFKFGYRLVTGVVDLEIQVTFKVMATIVKYVLHPIDFFNELAKDTELFFTHPLQAIEKLADSFFKPIYKEIKALYDAMVKELKVIYQDFKHLVEDIEKLFMSFVGIVEEVISYIVDAFEDFTREIEHIF